MPVELFDLCLVQSSAPCAEWDVYLRKMGGRVLVKSMNRACGEAALVWAKELAEFLGVPLVVKESGPR